ncbi:MAG: phosphonopyruvate decarboxylase [Oscillospiraceae bacterium]|nr:phosphonopyruvate decarboxylase [Oscillospiraceae bacterium]
MIDTNAFLDYLKENGLDFFTGVPDSLLKNFCACVTDNCDKKHNIIAANEGNAVGIACGYYLSTGKFGVVYMQNSGIGNAVNPLVSLADDEVYKIPLLMLVGWRGEPGTTDEPQHKKQGKITFDLFKAMGIETVILDDDYKEKIQHCIKYMKEYEKPVALIVRKNTFSEYKYGFKRSDYSLSRERALEIILNNVSEDDIIVSTTGKTSRELFELRETKKLGHSNDFLTVGSMGHTSSIALGVSLFTDKHIYCIDGDGSFIMHMGATAVNAVNAGGNYRYIIINNGAHESVGGQPTAGFDIGISGILANCGFENVCTASDEKELECGMDFLSKHEKSAMIVYVRQGSRSNLGRPDLLPWENKKLLMEKLKNESTDI